MQSFKVENNIDGENPKWVNSTRHLSEEIKDKIVLERYNADVPYKQIAQELNVKLGAINQRIKKLKDQGLITHPRRKTSE